MTRGAAKGTLQLSAEHALALVTGYFATLILARGLGPEAFGLYGVVLSVIGWAEQAGQFGLPSAATRLIAQGGEEEEAVGRTTFVIGSLSYGAVFLAFFGAAPWIAGLLHARESAGLFRLAALDIPLYGTYFIVRGVGLGKRRFGVLAAAGIIIGFVKLAGVVLLASIGFSVEGAILVVIASSLVGFTVLLSRIPLRWTRPTREIVVALLRLAVPLALAAIALSLLHQLHLWILKALSGEGAEGTIGIYVAAATLAKAPEITVIAVGSVLFPSISRAVAEGNRREALEFVYGAVRFLWLVLLPVSVLVMIDAERIMTFLFSSKYAGGGKILAIQILAFNLMAFVIAFYTMLLGGGAFRRVLALVYGMIAIMLALGFALVPGSGPVGAAAAFLGTTACGAVVGAVLVFRAFGGLILPKTFLRILLATAIALVAGLLFRAEGILLLPKYALVSAIYVVVLAASGELKKKDYATLLFWR